MRRSSIIGLVALWIAAITQPTPVSGQIAAEVNIGWNQGIAGPTESFPRGTTVSDDPVFATSFFIGSLVEEHRASRSGFGFVTQRDVLRIEKLGLGRISWSQARRAVAQPAVSAGGSSRQHLPQG